MINSQWGNSKYFTKVDRVTGLKRCPRHQAAFKEYIKKGNALRKAYLKTAKAARTTSLEAEYRKQYAIAYGRTYVNKLSRTVSDLKRQNKKRPTKFNSKKLADAQAVENIVKAFFNTPAIQKMRASLNKKVNLKGGCERYFYVLRPQYRRPMRRSVRSRVVTKSYRTFYLRRIAGLRKQLKTSNEKRRRQIREKILKFQVVIYGKTWVQRYTQRGYRLIRRW